MLELFCVFFKIGLLTFGGGYAMIPLIQQEVALNRDWMTLSQLTDLMAIAEATPGPFAINTATFVGWTQHHFLGAAVATAGLVLPSFLIMLVVAWCFAGFAQNRFVRAGILGLRPAVIGLIAAAVWSLALLFFFQNENGAVLWQRPNLATIALSAFLFALDFRFKLHPVALIGIAMVLGCFIFGLR